MKLIELCFGFVLILCCNFLHVQLKFGGDPYTIHPFAILELDSSGKGVLLPRMTTEQREQAFPSHIPEGLLLFNSDQQLVAVFTLTKGWQPIAFAASETINVFWEAHQLQIGNNPLIDFSVYLPRPYQQISLN
ncbi:MAG: hypothetical protein ACON43_07615 [Flavobacteriaceae bacterium]